jgi:hypothetical protein
MNNFQLDPSKGRVPSDEEKGEAKEYVHRFKSKESARSNWENTWEDCQDYIVPRKGSITGSNNSGEKRGELLFDTTAIMANQLLAGALHGILTNGATRFFDLMMVPPDEDLNEIPEVQDWLQDSAEKMFKVLNNSNFQTEIHEVYIDLGSIGTAALFIGEHPERVVHFSARPIKEIYIDENSEGLVDCVDRKFSWTARQLIGEFGVENCPPDVIKKYNEADTCPFEILHCTYPMSDEEYAKRGSINRYKSAYVLMDPAMILKESLFPEFPYAVPRWAKTSGEQYGRGPGMDMLPDIKMLNKMMETTLKGAQKTVDPPLMVNDDGVIGKVRLTPGGLTVIRPFSTPGEAPIKPLITDARIDFGEKMIEMIRTKVRSGFYVDQFQTPQLDRQSATEVNVRSEEQMRLMGPVLGRQHFEFLAPTIFRVFGIMNRKNQFKPAPKQLQGKQFGVRYSSLLARAQRMKDAEVFMRGIQTVAPLVNARPAALDNLDEDKSFNYVLGDLYGLPRKCFRGDQEIKKMRDARQAAAEQAAKEAQQQHQADIASKMGGATAQVAQAQASQIQAGSPQ